VSRASTLPEPWLALCLAVGSVGDLAKKLQTSPVNVWRWAHGKTRPGPLVRDATNRIARRYGVAEPFPEGLERKRAAVAV
jgi:hypothetical protein